MNNIIYNEDCLKTMSRMPDNYIDVIITSPPYNLGKYHHTGNKNTNSYSDNMNEEEYQDWQLQVLNECYRVLKKDGYMFYNHKNRIKNGTQITPYSWILKSLFNIKQEIIWINRSQNFDKIRFYPWTERIYWLTKNPKTKIFNSLNKPDYFDWKEWKPVGTKGSHKRAFPVKMVEDLLSVCLNAKIVYDPFMGSGTTALACINLGKQYIGSEIEKEYVDLSRKNIENKSIAI